VAAGKEGRLKIPYLSEIVLPMKFGFLHLKQALPIACVFAGLFSPAGAAQPPGEGEKIVRSGCVGCHRIKGVPMPRSTKQAPDLIWAGNKY